MKTLPEGFLWGTGASSTQTEGAAPASDWARWESLGRAPASGDGNGFATHYREDFSLLAELGLTQHRLSLEWARLEPREGEHDPVAVEHYREMLTAAKDTGIDVWVCLHHFTLPGWFSDDLGGFLDDRGLGYHWPRHVDWVAETFGDLVAGWKPVNEPLAYAAGGFLSGTMPPGRADLGDFMDALRASHLANVAAWRLLRGGEQPVATVMNLSPVRNAPTSLEPEAAEKAREWAELVEHAFWGCWLGLLRDGVWTNPFGGVEEVRDAAGAFDLVGFSYYSAVSVDQGGELHPYPADARKGPLGDSRYPEGLAECLDRLAEELPDRRLLVSEVGLGTFPDDPSADDERCEYMERVHEIVTDAVDGGIDVAGLFWWTGIDNYEWLEGFDASFGMIDRNRVARPSAQLAARWALGDDPGSLA
jgi:beta-glucosidase